MKIRHTLLVMRYRGFFFRIAFDTNCNVSSSGWLERFLYVIHLDHSHVLTLYHGTVFRHMAKKILRSGPSDDYDFILVGIVCQAREYRLCHFLNQHLHIRLQRSDDYEIMKPANRLTLAFSQYTFDPGEDARYYLFANKTESGILVTDHKNMDYFLMIKDYHNRVSEERLMQDLKNIPVILGAYAVQPDRLRARDNLIF
jgi:hypothetical protein